MESTVTYILFLSYLIPQRKSLVIWSAFLSRSFSECLYHSSTPMAKSSTLEDKHSGLIFQSYSICACFSSSTKPPNGFKFLHLMICIPSCILISSGVHFGGTMAVTCLLFNLFWVLDLYLENINKFLYIIPDSYFIIKIWIVFWICIAG